MIECNLIAKGGEAAVYRVDHVGLDEIVVKCTLFDENTNMNKIRKCFSSIMYESQTLKML